MGLAVLVAEPDWPFGQIWRLAGSATFESEAVVAWFVRATSIEDTAHATSLRHAAFLVERNSMTWMVSGILHATSPIGLPGLPAARGDRGS